MPGNDAIYLTVFDVPKHLIEDLVSRAPNNTGGATANPSTE